MQAGARPVFVDIDPETLNIDPAAIAGAITAMTKAIVPVDLFGLPADADAISAVASEHGLVVVEDACQAFGASYKGRRAGSLGDLAVFSFFPTKNLGGYGDGGLVTGRIAEFVEMARMLRFHGSRDKKDFDYIGFNSRLDEIQAAVLRIGLTAHRRLERAARPGRGLVRRRACPPTSRRPAVPDGLTPRLPPLRGAQRAARRSRRRPQGRRRGLRRLLHDAAAPAAGASRTWATSPATSRRPKRPRRPTSPCPCTLTSPRSRSPKWPTRCRGECLRRAGRARLDRHHELAARPVLRAHHPAPRGAGPHGHAHRAQVRPDRAAPVALRPGRGDHRPARRQEPAGQGRGPVQPLGAPDRPGALGRVPRGRGAQLQRPRRWPPGPSASRSSPCSTTSTRPSRTT